MKTVTLRRVEFDSRHGQYRFTFSGGVWERRVVNKWRNFLFGDGCYKWVKVRVDEVPDAVLESGWKLIQ